MQVLVGFQKLHPALSLWAAPMLAVTIIKHRLKAGAPVLESMCKSRFSAKNTRTVVKLDLPVHAERFPVEILTRQNCISALDAGREMSPLWVCEPCEFEQWLQARASAESEAEATC